MRKKYKLSKIKNNNKKKEKKKKYFLYGGSLIRLRSARNEKQYCGNIQ